MSPLEHELHILSQISGGHRLLGSMDMDIGVKALEGDQMPKPRKLPLCDVIVGRCRDIKHQINKNVDLGRDVG